MIPSQEQLHSLSRYMQASREEERKSIAREIHDDLGQTLVALKMDLTWLGKRLPKDEKPLIEKKIKMEQTLVMAIESVHRIISNLRPRLLDDLGLIPAIEWQVTAFQERTGIQVSFSVNSQDLTLDNERATAVFRIIQEALNNIARHAKATKADIVLRVNGEEILLKIRDNGRGITEEQIAHPASFGLLGMRERAHAFGGKAVIGRDRRHGTSVIIKIPQNDIADHEKK